MPEDYLKGVASLKETKNPVLYEGSNIEVTVKDTFLNPQSGLPAVTDKKFDASKLKGLDLVVYGFTFGQEPYQYEEVSEITSTDGQNLYKRKNELKELKRKKVRGLVEALNKEQEISEEEKKKRKKQA